MLNVIEIVQKFACNEQMKQCNELKWKSLILQDNGFSLTWIDYNVLFKWNMGVKYKVQMKQSNNLNENHKHCKIMASPLSWTAYNVLFKSNMGLKYKLQMNKWSNQMT